MLGRVGGIVSETNFKFFIQFVSWTAIYCIFTLICLAVFSKEIASKVSRAESLCANEIISLVLSTPSSRSLLCLDLALAVCLG